MRRHARAASIALLLATLLSGCAPRSYLVLLENTDGSTGKVIVEGSDGRRQVVERAGDGVSLAASPAPVATTQETLSSDFGPAMAALPPPPTSFLLYFETAAARLTPESRNQLPRVLAQVRSRPAPDISIIGHTDTVGSNADNEALGLVRARTVLKLLEAAGVTAREITVTSHGERNLLVPTADNTDEARNRRVEVTVR
ncbi:OmpA family protein [Azoarcus olearius]|uniref:Conserved hypothetical secreted protein n=1 Tax=Azoarcus sp. (strain BH72) TaxID=418699 RepID=A1K341_AZOSB|nr:OmpA family protein [Azoarcus olearius]CAL93246.1 conserved hypothetical secreted protein [Azoarcus olearius]